jgi:hypothetical protein
MSYLKQLEQEKKAREQYEQDLERLKVYIIDLEVLTNKHDGLFLNELEELINKWKS